MAALAGCAVEPGPPGGERPALAAVPGRGDPRYDAFERTVLRDALAAAAAEAERAGAVAAARGRGEPPPAPVDLPPPPAIPPEPPQPPPPPPEISPEENLVGADDLVALAAAIGRDRRELARRLRIREAREAASAPTFERVTAVAFPPAGTRLSERERTRLERALEAGGTAGAWIVRTGGGLAEARAEAVREALVAAGVAPEDVATGALDRDVDVAEIAVRR
ncbi:MAG: hypothetical protein GVY33_14225 [Alphaproteobacteria bacterium]|nr:hypothetical protein [Alphaproteobacteria bacterium]